MEQARPVIHHGMNISKFGVPLIMVNGNFRSLHTLSIEELETFIPFMTSCALKKPNSTSSRGTPKWWARSINFKFPLRKPKGLSNLGYFRHLRSMVCKCYGFHDAHFLLTFSSQFAEYPQSIFLRSNPNNTTTVFSIESVSEIFTFDNENKEYDNKPGYRPWRIESLGESSQSSQNESRDVYLCENCDTEFYNRADMVVHEQDGCETSTADDSDEIQVLAHIRPPPKEPSEKDKFMNSFGLCSAAQRHELLYPPPKPREPEIPERSWVILDMCLHKNRKIEFSSVVGRRMLRYRVKRDVLTRSEKAHIATREVCGNSLTAARDGREMPKPKITYRAPKKKVWSHNYCFTRKQKMERLSTIKNGLDKKSLDLLKKCKPLTIQLQSLKLPTRS